jgi:hypothetical protein
VVADVGRRGPTVAEEGGSSSSLSTRTHGRWKHDRRWTVAFGPREQAEQWRPRRRRGAPATGSLGNRACGAEHGEAKAVTHSVGTEVECSSGWAELHRLAMAWPWP